jgi:hypothetical protein
VVEFAKKMREGRLTWYERVIKICGAQYKAGNEGEL